MQNHLLFKDISNDIISYINKSCHKKHISKNEIIFLREDEVNYIYFVKSGWVKIFTETLSGEEAILDIISKGCVFGEGAIVDNGRNSYSAEAVDAVELVLIPINKLKEILNQSLQLAYNLLKLASLKQKYKDIEVEHLSLQNAAQRIGCFLLRLCKPDDDLNVYINLPYDKFLVASRLGMKPETFSRALAKLRDDVAITTKGGSINIASVQSLVKYSCSSCSSRFPCEDILENVC